METIDPIKAKNVWQRVQGSAPPVQREEGLTELIAREMEDANIYLQLARRLPGKHSVILRKMAEQEQAHAACLKGIYTLLTGKRPAVSGVPTNLDDPIKVLRLCYGREMRCLARYEQRINDPEYGAVFSRLAEQERTHCHMVLELLGSLYTK